MNKEITLAEAVTIEEAGGSLNDYVDIVRDAWYAQNLDNRGWVVDVFEDHIVYRTKVDNVPVFFKVNYSKTDDSISFDDPAVWTRVKLEYMEDESSTASDDAEAIPVVQEATEASLEAEPDVNELDIIESHTCELEEVSNGRGKPRSLEAVIVTAGKSGRKNVYTEGSLKTGIPVFSGAKVYRNHPTRQEMRDRPERSVDDLVGRLGKAYVGTNKAGLPALRAPLMISSAEEALKTKVSEGVVDAMSIRARGVGKRDDDGNFVVEAFVPTKHTSVDFVTVASAGGYPEIVEMTESSTPNTGDGVPQIERITIEVLEALRPDLVEAIKGASSGTQDKSEIQELREANERLESKLEELSSAAYRDRAIAIFTDVFESAKTLPTATQRRIKESADGIIAGVKSEEDLETLEESFAELVSAEREYVSRLHGVPVTNVPERRASSTVREKVSSALEEAFTDIVPEGTADIALRGRPRRRS